MSTIAIREASRFIINAAIVIYMCGLIEPLGFCGSWIKGCV